MTHAQQKEELLEAARRVGDKKADAESRKLSSSIPLVCFCVGEKCRTFITTQLLERIVLHFAHALVYRASSRTIALLQEQQTHFGNS